MMSLSLDEPRPIDSRGRASPPGEASSGELSGELISLWPKKQADCRHSSGSYICDKTTF